MSIATPTGPLMANDLREQNPDLEMEPPGSDPVSAVGPELFERPQRLIKRLGGPGNATRMALLGILLSELQDVQFQVVAEMLDVKPARLEAIMHGDVQVPPHREARWETLAQIILTLHRVLKPSATGLWLHTSVPDLGGRTPLEAIKRGQLDPVLNLTRSYLDPSFS